jgi:Zn-dependent protease
LVDDLARVLQTITNMFRSYRLGTLFGFPIRVNFSFLLFLLVVLFWAGGLDGFFVALLTAGSVLLHELGHALVARQLGVPIAGIELHVFGGAAQMTGMPRSPGDEIAVAAAGPAVSLALAGLGHGLAAVTGVPFFALFGWINLLLGAFNLLPAFPSDGGRILRALLARRRGLVSATDLAVKVGRWVCAALGLVGLFTGSFQLALIAGVLWMMGGAERVAVRLRGEPDAWRGPETRAIPDVEYIPPPGPSARRYRVVWPPAKG